MTPTTRTTTPDRLHGLMAEFATPEALLEAARGVREAGYERMDAYSPFEIEELAAAIGFDKNRLPLVVLLGGLLGGGLGYFMLWYANVIDYPLNVGGRPHHSWPAFIPITFEMTILFAAFAAIIGLFALNRLPKPYHPVFNVERFARASQDRFFLCIEADDPLFDIEQTRRLLLSFRPVDVSDVEN